MKEKTDWIAWVMHAVVGLAAGLLFGYLVTHDRGGRSWLRAGCLAQFIWSAGLVGAGLGSIFGDTMWAQLPYRLFPPEKVKAGVGGKTVSALAIVSGVGLAGTAHLRHFCM
jgi:hypothetical protein